MNFELIKAKMDKFFAETTSEELIERFEALGYIFVNMKHSHVRKRKRKLSGKRKLHLSYKKRYGTTT